jgi:hypothetical protein
MESNNDPRRNRPADRGDRNDPHIRDEDGRQPGVSTMSSSDSEEANEDLTETAADNFREGVRDRNADPDFDDVDYTDKDGEDIY